MIKTSMPWIKLHTRWLDDVRLARVSDSAALRFFELVLLAGECGSDFLEVDGEPVSLNYIAHRLRSTTAQLTNDIDELRRVRLIAGNPPHSPIEVLGFEESQEYTGRYYGETKDEWLAIKTHIFKRDHHRCVYCGAPASHADHIHPRALGGGNEESNLVASCASCNMSKGKRLLHVWYPAQTFYQPERHAYIAKIASEVGNG